MSESLQYALLSLAPAAGIFAGYPRRPWAAGTALVLSAAGSAAVLVGASPQAELQSRIAAGWSLFACLYVFYICRKNAVAHQSQLEAVEQTRIKSLALGKHLEENRDRGLEAGREQKETQALYGVIKGLSEAMTWEEIRPKIETAVDQYLGVDAFALYIADMRGNQEFHPLAIKNMAASAGGTWATLSRCLQEQGFTAAGPQVIESPEKAIALPIQDNAELLGYFYARVPQGMEPAALLAKTWTFAFEIAFALRRVKLFQEVERLSRIDGLTGVYRRGDFDERIKEETIRAKTFKSTYGLMLLDIDHFKELNDRYGHPFGDQVLRRIGELLNMLVYDTDFVARYGGEEFVVLLPRAEPAGALRKAEAIRRTIESERFAIALETVQVTVSIGVAHFPRDAGTPHELIAQADQAMYQAKSQGRNRVVDCSSIRA